MTSVFIEYDWYVNKIIYTIDDIFTWYMLHHYHSIISKEININLLPESKQRSVSFLSLPCVCFKTVGLFFYRAFITLTSKKKKNNSQCSKRAVAIIWMRAARKRAVNKETLGINTDDTDFFLSFQATIFVSRVFEYYCIAKKYYF